MVRNSDILAQCHPDLIKLFDKVGETFDCTVISGYRGEAEQNSAYDKGFSKVKFPNSKHNQQPSMAVDVVPYPINWKDVNRMRYFAGYVLGIAKGMGIAVRWGGDWDMDTQTNDQRFDDLPHFELI